MQEGTSKDLPHWDQRGLGPDPTLHHHGYKMSKHASLSHFALYIILFGRHPIPLSSIVAQMDQVVDLDSPATWARGIAKRAVLFRRVMTMAMENLYIAQHRNTLWYAYTRGGNYKPKVTQFDVGDFVYF